MNNELFTRMTAAEYDGGSKQGEIYAPFTKMVEVLGTPHRTTDTDYPDDDYKTDVCWGIRSTGNPTHIISIWNYKNGPNYNGGEGMVEEIDYFSVYYTDATFWNQVCSLIVS